MTRSIEPNFSFLDVLILKKKLDNCRNRVLLIKIDNRTKFNPCELIPLYQLKERGKALSEMTEQKSLGGIGGCNLPGGF